MGAFQPTHVIIILAVVLLLFGGSKIPEMMKGIGKGMGELKKGLEEGKRELAEATESPSVPEPLRPAS